MEKIILKKVTLMFISIFIFIFAITSISIVLVKNNAVKKELTETIEQVENSYKQSKSNIEVSKNFFENDYLNRAYAIDYILNNYLDENLNKESLDKIKELMEINEISIIDKKGYIILSTDERYIGINLFNYNEASEFWDLIKDDDENKNVIQIDGKSILEGKDKIYIGVKSKVEEFSVIEIEVEKSIYENLIKKDNIDYIVRNIPTIYEKAIFLIDKETKHIHSITKNNDQNLVFDKIDSEEEFIDELYYLENYGIRKVNGEYRFIKTKVVDDYIIGSYIDIKEIYISLLLEILLLSLGIILGLTIILILLKRVIKKYILKDLGRIKEDIAEVIDGNYNAEFKTEYDTELKDISNILNDWKDSYKYKAERMTRIMSVMDNYSAIFECLYQINKNFFSDNMKDILGLDNEKWKEISKRPRDFEKYIDSIAEKDSIVKINNRYLSIVAFKKEDEFYGMIIDKTNDENLKNEIKKESETDALTKLLNRNGLENKIRNTFNDNEDSALIIFDLDNFKRVNDELGHPVGDEVLKIFSKCLVSSFRKNDIISRMGGDEFIVFINKNIKEENLLTKLNELLNKIRTDLKFYYENYGISTSIGVAYKSKKNNTYEKLYKEADKALYKAKSLGKDRFYINKKY